MIWQRSPLWRLWHFRSIHSNSNSSGGYDVNSAGGAVQRPYEKGLHLSIAINSNKIANFSITTVEYSRVFIMNFIVI